jgi:hypothetical protein
MKFHLISRLYKILSWMLLVFLIKASAQTGFPAPVIPEPFSEKGLFDADEVLQITLKGNVRNLLNDRTDIPKNYSLALSYRNEDSTEITMPVDVKTRGHFRRLKENCTYPPLLIQFAKEGPHLSSVFREQKKLKLVMPCKGDEYLIREWLVYKLYNLVTPKSFRARLVKVTLEDAKNKKPVTPFYGILLEEEKQLAKRNKVVSVVRKLKPEQVQADAFLTMTVFEYLIGNTDWSVQYLQNVKLLAKDSTAVPETVPYDFDHAGIVSTPYALPAEELQMSSVRQRRYRGYCVRDMKVFDDVIARYNELKKDIYSLYSDCNLLDAKYIKSTIKYLDDFYEAINNPKAWRKDFAYPCDKNGTGNVVIKGLKDE